MMTSNSWSSKCDSTNRFGFVTCDPIGSSLKGSPGPAPAPEVEPGVEDPLSWLLVVESRPPTPDDSDFRCPDCGRRWVVEEGCIVDIVLNF